MKTFQIPDRRMSLSLFIFLVTCLTACNLGRPSQQREALQITAAPETRPELAISAPLPTTRPPATPLALSSPLPVVATRVFTAPTVAAFPTHTTQPISIYLSAPVANSVVSGSTQIFGSAIHPGFLQYRLEYATVPNPQNIWYPVASVGHRPVVNSILGHWNTTNRSLANGSYQLRLRVFLIHGSEQNIVVSPIYLQNQVLTAPTVAPARQPLPSSVFTLSATSGYAPLSVTFHGPTGPSILTYSWTFGDGQTSNEANPTHVFTSPGEYSVSLTVSGPSGSSSYAQPITVDARRPPIAAFDASPLSGPAPLQVQFGNRSTGNIASFVWRYGDGNENRSDMNPSYTYAAEGSYIVELVLNGPDGQSSASKQIIVSAEQIDAPVARFEIDVSDDHAPISLRLINTSNGVIDSIVWSLNGADLQPDSDGNATTEILEAGDYLVQLAVAGPGGSDTISQSIIVSAPIQAPVADFVAEPSRGNAPLTVSFSNRSQNADVGYEWDFQNDGIVDSTESDPVWTYQTAGDYSAQLRAVGDGGAAALVVQIVVDPPVASPLALIAADTTSGDAPLQVNFSNQSTGQVDSYQWDFQGDGDIDSNEVSLSYVFASPGIYNVMLSVIGSGGASQASIEIVVTEAILPPVAGFTTSVNDLTAVFLSTASGESLTYYWDFGDGNTSNEENPTHVYGVAGSYIVVQQVSNPAGSISHSVEVAVVALPIETPAPTGRIAFVSDRDGNNEIYLMNSDGADALNLTNNPANDRHPSWSPDGRQLAFASRRDDDNFEIYRLDIASQAVTRLTETGSDNRPAWSPDGARIAFASQRAGNRDIFLMNTDGSQQTQLSTSAANEDQPTWSPDGNYIAYVTDADGQRHISVINVADGAIFNTIRSDSGENFLPAWLNDRERSLLLFTSTRFGDEDIFMVNPLNGEDLRQITSASTIERQPNWSRDGSLILFVSDRTGQGSRDIYTITSDGSSVTRLTPDGSKDREPKWH